MKDFLLDNLNNDLVIDETSNFVFVEDESLVAQRVVQRLETGTNEWLFDTELGIDYLGQVLVKAPDLGVIRAMFISEVNTTEGVGAVTKYQQELEDRRLIVEMEFTAGEETVELRGAQEGDGFSWTQL